MNSKTEHPPRTLENPFIFDINGELILFEGIFQIKNEERKMKYIGKIYFNFKSAFGLNFEGESHDPCVLLGYFYDKEKTKLEFLDNGFENVWVTETSSRGNQSTIKGQIVKEAIWGYFSSKIVKIKFAIPNFTKFRGVATRIKDQEELHIKFNRINLKTKDYEINIDTILDYDEISKEIKYNRNRSITHLGELLISNSKFEIKDLRKVQERLTFLLSFLNGSLTGPLLIQGYDINNNILWQDFSVIPVAYQMSNFEWWQNIDNSELNNMWNFIYALDNEIFKVLDSALQIYLNASREDIDLNVRLFLANNGLELLFNFIIIEKKEVLFGEDIDRLSLANKIRLLLNELCLNSEIPNNLTNLKNFVNNKYGKDKKVKKDGPMIITEIRNTIVHPKLKNREVINTIARTIKIESLLLSNHYFELAILYCLEYKGLYLKKVDFVGDCDVNYNYCVPWVR